MVPIMDYRRRMNMVLLIDLGNRALSFSLYSEKKEKLLSYKTYPDLYKSEDEYADSFLQFFFYQKIEVNKIEGVILSSVVPSLTERVKRAVEKAIGKRCMILNKKLKTSLAIRMDNPNELGSDLIATAIGAIDEYQKDCLIVDLSSVLSFTIVTKKREFLGGSLFPGIRESSHNMMKSSAQLMEIELEPVKRKIGKSTKESMNSGIVSGYISLIKNFSKELEEESKLKLLKIATGDDLNIVKDQLLDDFIIDRDLIFKGLYDIYIKNKENEL